MRNREFFLLPSTELAPRLLGKVICRRNNTEVLRARITETECYFGAGDSACHAKRGITKGNKSLFSIGGTAYVYLCYGIHYLFNIVSGEAGHGEGVLIRGIEGATGPGRVSKKLGIDKAFDGHDITTSTELWLEDEGFSPSYEALPRIGIDYATDEDKALLWRFRTL